VSVELFLLRDGSLTVNEIAPRVHKQRPLDDEGAGTSQFEQHIRAICGLPLGDPTAHGPTAMSTCSAPGTRGRRTSPESPRRSLTRLPNLHMYAKRTVFERRKMAT